MEAILETIWASRSHRRVGDRRKISEFRRTFWMGRPLTTQLSPESSCFCLLKHTATNSSALLVPQSSQASQSPWRTSGVNSGSFKASISLRVWEWQPKWLKNEALKKYSPRVLARKCLFFLENKTREMSLSFCFVNLRRKTVSRTWFEKYRRK